MRIESQALCELGWFTTCDRHGKNIAKKIERDSFAIGANIKRHPRAFVSFNGNSSPDLQRKIFFLFRFLFFYGVSLGLFLIVLCAHREKCECKEQRKYVVFPHGDYFEY